MHNVTAEQVHALLDYPPLVEALRDLFRRGVDEAKAIHLTEKLPDGRENIWLLLPAWQHGRHQGVKLVSVFPGNEAKGLLSVVGVYVLFDGTNGYPLAVIDGAALTLRKTAANSALAATYLARKDAAKLLMLGAGQLAPHLAMAHCAVRPIREVRVWNRNAAKAQQMAAALQLPGVRVEVASDLESAVRWADVISAATMAKEPLIKGAWLRARPASGSRRRLPAGHARGRRRCRQARPRLHRCLVHRRRPLRRYLQAAGSRPHRQGRHHRYVPTRARREAGPAKRRRDHPVQIRRRRP